MWRIAAVLDLCNIGTQQIIENIPLKPKNIIRLVRRQGISYIFLPWACVRYGWRKGKKKYSWFLCCTSSPWKITIIHFHISAFLCNLVFGVHAWVAENKMYFLKIRNVLNVHDENSMHWTSTNHSDTSLNFRCWI